jgi:hypothetical protein
MAPPRAAARTQIAVVDVAGAVSSRFFVPAVGSHVAGRGGDSQWIFPAAGLVFFQYAAAIVIAHAIHFMGRPPTVKYMLIALVISLAGGSIIVFPTVWRFWREREPSPLARLVSVSDLTAVASYLIGFQMFALQMGALTWLKEMLPAVVPFWADSPLAELDRIILGTDAWRLVPEVLVHPLDVIYVTWAPITAIAINLILCLKPSAVKTRAILAYFLIVGLMGVCGQYLLSSAGPVFYDRLFGGHHFADLMTRIETHAPVVNRTVDYLWASYTNHVDQLGIGISAMPSLHVAVAAWFALALSAFWPRLRVPAWGFWLVMFIGSFALGWHYFVDGLVGTVGALGCWAFAGGPLRRFHDRVRSETLVPVR